MLTPQVTDDRQYGSAAMCDVEALSAINRRVHFGTRFDLMMQACLYPRASSGAIRRRSLPRSKPATVGSSRR